MACVALVFQVDDMARSRSLCLGTISFTIVALCFLLSHFANPKAFIPKRYHVLRCEPDPNYEGSCLHFSSTQKGATVATYSFLSSRIGSSTVSHLCWRPGRPLGVFINTRLPAQVYSSRVPAYPKDPLKISTLICM
jgi:hypothetical protein